MSPRTRGSGGARRSSFFLAERPAPDRPVRLEQSEIEHAQRVLRLAAGDPLFGVDGAGGRWPLVVRVSERKRFEVELDGDAEHEPAPGEPGAPLPRIEVAVPLPKGARAEEMVDRLTQLGIAAVVPLVTQRTTVEARGEGDRRGERLVRAAREACKQSGRLWVTEIGAAIELDALLARGTEIVWFAPEGEGDLGSRLARVDGARGITLVIGPEGGWSAEEEGQMRSRGPAVRLAPYVLRVETAAEAAAAVTVSMTWSMRSGSARTEE